MAESMSCHDARPLLSAYLDAELPASEAAAIEQHLAACAACTQELATLRELSRAMRRNLPAFEAPDLLRTRVAHALEGERLLKTAPPPSRRAAIWTRRIAAMLLIAATSSVLTRAVMLRSLAGPDVATGDVVATHVRSLMSNHLTDVVSTDEHNVKPWFDGKVPFAPEVVRLDSAEFVLIGGRVDSVGHEPVAALVYGRRKHVINLFTWPARAIPADAGIATSTEHGYNVLRWSRGDMRFAAVSDVAMPDLREFVDAFRRASPPPEGSARP